MALNGDAIGWTIGVSSLLFMKRPLTTFLSGIGLFALPFLAAAAAPFTDTASSPYAEAIAYVKSAGIVQGYPDGTFRPDNTINRAEFIKILVYAKYSQDEIQACLHNIQSLWDIPLSAWYAAPICTAFRNGAVSGYPDGTFRPERTINFAEAAKILTHVFEVPRPDLSDPRLALFRSRMAGLDAGPDNPYWWHPYAVALSDQHVIPLSIQIADQSITRGEMAEMIWRLKADVTNQPSRTYEELALSTNDQTSITIFFYAEQDVRDASYKATFPVQRQIPKTFKVADGTLRALFAGPTAAELAQGARTMDILSSLGKDYIGVNIYGSYPNPYYWSGSPESPTWQNVAVVDFRSPAFDILNGPAGTQSMAKAPIEATLLAFPTVDHVLYKKDGVIFTEWDA